MFCTTRWPAFALASMPAMLYARELAFYRSRYGRAAQRRLAKARGDHRAWWTAEEYVREAAPSRSVVDVGGMWKIDGEYSFVAEESGATDVTCLDMYATDEFRKKLTERSSKVRLVLGDAMADETIAQIGVVDLVMCFGVLYHVPDPSRFIEALARMCREKLILETLTTPEVPGVPHAAVYLPHLDVNVRRRYDTAGSGGTAGLGIGSDFDPEEGFANNFWALSPSCVTALLRSHGFRVTHIGPSPSGRLRHVFLADKVS
jgi:SAM-dependent methyltransferase